MTGKIEFIDGTNNILLIAPHGHSKNDMNTGRLARLMAKKLDCYAVINEHYRRPYTDKETKIKYKTNKKDSVVNLNNISSIKSAKMEDEFLQPIFDIKKRIFAVGANEKMFVILLHGVADDDEKKIEVTKNEPFILVGFGRGNEPRLSAGIKYVEDFVKSVVQNKEHPIVTRIETGGKYSGWDRQNLNQLFTGVVDPKTKDDKVQSIQLEIKYTGFRDMDNLDKTADVLSSALRDIAGLKEEDKKEPQSPEKAVAPAPEQDESTDVDCWLPENEVMKPSAKNSIPVTEEHPDEAFVEEAFSKLAGIFFSHYQNALLEAGKYIIDTFYDGDVERARQKKPVKEASYTQLVERLQERKEVSPRKSWLFNAVNLVIQEHDFASVQALGQLKTTQKLLLLPVHDADCKQRLAIEAAERNYTTRQLAEAIKNSKPEPKETLLSYIKKPEELFSGDKEHIYSMASLEVLPPKEREAIRKQISGETEKIQGQIANQQRYLQQYQIILKNLPETGKEKTVKKR